MTNYHRKKRRPDPTSQEVKTWKRQQAMIFHSWPSIRQACRVLQYLVSLFPSESRPQVEHEVNEFITAMMDRSGGKR